MHRVPAEELTGNMHRVPAEKLTGTLEKYLKAAHFKHARKGLGMTDLTL